MEEMTVGMIELKKEIVKLKSMTNDPEQSPELEKLTQGTKSIIIKL